MLRKTCLPALLVLLGSGTAQAQAANPLPEPVPEAERPEPRPVVPGIVEPPEALIPAGMGVAGMIGAELGDGHGGSLGRIRDLVVGEEMRLALVIAEVGAIAGIGGRDVAIPLQQLRLPTEGDAAFMLDIGAEELELLPTYEQVGGLWRPAPDEPQAAAPR